MSEISKFYNELDFESLRVRRPYRIVFLCGGKILTNDDSRIVSMRDLLCRHEKNVIKWHGKLILAEEANQVYRDTTYGDLISFEEDLARLSSLVVVIAESPGSLAELGAFASSDIIRPSVRVIISENHWNAESFVRFGPIERLHRLDPDSAGVFPWTIENDGTISTEQAYAIKDDVVKFINDHTDKLDQSNQWPAEQQVSVFYAIAWIIYVSQVVSFSFLERELVALGFKIKSSELKNKLFCLSTLGWIKKSRYSNKEYYFSIVDTDPFEYSFLASAPTKDGIRLKGDAARYAKEHVCPPGSIVKQAAAARDAST